MSEQKASILQNVGNAGLAAVLTVSLIHPMDTVKTRLQIAGEAGRKTANYNGSLSAIKIIASEGGISAFYKGIQAAWLRESVYTSLRLGLYEPVKEITGSATFIQKFLAGSISGALGSIAGNPFDVLKTRMMASEGSNLGLGHHFNDVLKNQGVIGLYRGMSANVSRAMILNATKMAVYDTAKQNVKSMLGLQDGLVCQFMSAFTAGFFMTVTVCPFDMTRTRLMNQPTDKQIYSGMVDCMRKVTANEGPLALYKGFFPVWARFAPTTTLQLLIFEKLRSIQGLKGI